MGATEEIEALEREIAFKRIVREFLEAKASGDKARVKELAVAVNEARYILRTTGGLPPAVARASEATPPKKKRWFS